MAEAVFEKLGGSSDGYSLIFKGRMKDGRETAIKRVITGTTDINEVNKLIELSKNKQHENVIRYYQLEEDDSFCYIYLELCNGNLYDFVEDPSFDRGGLDRKTAAKQIALGIEHIHRHGIYHLDLKPSNILVTIGSQKRLVLADFEVSKKVYDGKESIRTITFGGTIGWIAPEIEYFHEIEKRLTRKADIFSYGLLVYYIWTQGSHPFLKRPKIVPELLQTAQQRIKEYGCAKTSDSLELNMIDEKDQDDVLAKDLLSHLLEKTPELRPDARDIVKHPFFWNPYQQYEFYKQVGDCIESLRSLNQKFDASRRLQARIDQEKSKVIHDNWLNRLHPVIKPHFQSYRNPKGNDRTRVDAKRTSGLVKAIRNFWVHYSNKSKPVDVGLLPSHDASEGQVHTSLNSLAGNFPQLLLHTYKAALPWRDDVKLREFYPECDFPKFQELQDDKKGLTFENNGLCLKIAVVSTLVGPSGKDGGLGRIWDLCISDKDELVVADKYNARLIRMRKNGEYIATVATSEEFIFPTSVACGHRGELIISEPREDRVKILERTSDEPTIITEVNEKKLIKPHGIAINSNGEIFVCDSENGRIVSLGAGDQFEIGETGSGQNEMEHCLNAAFDKEDNIFVTDRVTNRIHVFSKDGNVVRCIGPQLSEQHCFRECRGIAIYDQYIVVSDFYEDKVHVLTTAGEHMCFVDGFNHPSGIVHDKNGIFYVCDTFNQRIVKLELRLEPVLSARARTDSTRSDARCKRKPEQGADTS